MTPIDYEARRLAVAKNIEAHGCDAYLATRQAALHYLGGVFMPWRGMMLITAKGEFTLFYWSGDAGRVRAEGAPMDIVEYTHDDLMQKVRQETDRLGISAGQLAVDLAHPGNAQPAPGILTAAEYLELLSTFPEATLHNGVDILDELLLIKGEAEVERMRAVCAIADYGFRAGCAALQTGVTENHVAGVIEAATRDQGSYWAWSVTAGTEVGFGPRTAFPRNVTQIATENRLEPNQFVIMDFHPSYELYLCDFSVPVFYGTPSPDQQALIHCWEEAVATVFRAVKPGAVIADVVEQGIQVYRRHGLYDYCLPRFGHGIGVCARTGPLLNAQNRDLFRPGMTFAMGAHLYRPGVGGLRLEYPVLVTGTGAQQLPQTPMKVHIIPVRS